LDAVIPAAGLATRMRGIPKFLLPCDDEYTTLIELHISQLLQYCETIWIPTRPELVLLLDSLGLAKDRVVILPMQTENMTQTVMKVTQISKQQHFQLVMPDTFFFGEKPYGMLDPFPSIAELACWKIRSEQKGKLGQVLIDGKIVTEMKDKDPDCAFEHSWGALTFSRELLDYADSNDPHIGYAVRNALISGRPVTASIVHGKYFDCGTPSEYLNMLGEVLGR
jgi:UTP-glucose-1-phosphate uridylyltransferase